MLAVYLENWRMTSLKLLLENNDVFVCIGYVFVLIMCMCWYRGCIRTNLIFIREGRSLNEGAGIFYRQCTEAQTLTKSDKFHNKSPE